MLARQEMRLLRQFPQRESQGLGDVTVMKVNEKGEIVVPASLVKNFGFKPGDSVEVEASRKGLLVKPNEKTAESVMKWLREEHGDEMATLTTDQILHLLK